MTTKFEFGPLGLVIDICGNKYLIIYKLLETIKNQSHDQNNQMLEITMPVGMKETPTALERDNQHNKMPFIRADCRKNVFDF